MELFSIRIQRTFQLVSTPRMKLVAKINGEFSKKGLLLIEVTGTVMKPTTSGLKKMAVGKVSASTASVSS